MKCMTHTKEGMRRAESPDQWRAPDAWRSAASAAWDYAMGPTSSSAT